MVHSFFFYFKFWLFMVLSLVMVIPLYVFRLFRLNKIENSYVLWATTRWARFILRITPAEVIVHGIDNLPEGGNHCFVANHQSAYDIPLIMAVIPRNIGFISKKELTLLPIVSTWMRAMHCVFIDRKSPRKAVKQLEKAVKNLQAGHSMVVFPEGTRSRSAQMRTFRTGSLKIAFRAGSTIVPITIKDTYKLREEHDRITPGTVELFIHKPVPTAHLTPENRRELGPQLETTIAAPLRNPD
jgi:1-acyl-sn-glycerol-3-phosphate acyltransferase